MVLLAGLIGLRAAECAGLSVQDLNLRKRVLIVRKTNSEAGGKLHLKIHTKTRTAEEVPLAAWMCRMLDDHIPHFPSEDGFVFTSPRGAPLRWRNFYDRYFKPAVIEAGIDPTFEFRWLRDTTSTNGQHIGGQPPKVMQMVLRHSTLDRTQHVYTHFSPESIEGLTQAWAWMLEEAAEETGSAFAARLLHEDDSAVISIGARTYVPVGDLGQ